MQEAPFKIYNASAGSGKTYTLAKEYLKIILASNKGYRQILAITFTNKAVNEMKHRILGSLFNFSRPNIPQESMSMFSEICEALKLDSNTLQKKSKAVLKDILHNYAFFDISTIDKFTHRLIRTFAKDLKLPQNFEVVLDTDLLLDEAVSKLINKAGKDVKLTQVLIDFALEKIDDDKSWDISLDLNKVGKLLFNENQSPHLKKIAGKEIDDFLRLKKQLLLQIGELQESLVSNASKALSIIDENGLEFSDFTASYFPKFMLKIQGKTFNIDFKAGWKQNFESSTLYNKSCPEHTKGTLDKLHPEFIIIFNNLKIEHSSLQFLKNAYTNIVPLTVLNAIQKEVKAIQIERDQLSISEFNAIISNEIKNQPAPFIYERLGEKYKHYFVDEFQDTSTMQWSNLEPLIGNALEGEDLQGKKGSLFLVGDAKQAIYRWRGGRAEQFLNLTNKERNPFVIAPEVENLPKNYRSYEEVVNFNNDFFSLTSPFLKNEMYHALFEEGNKQEHTSKQGGLVQLQFIEKDEENKLDTLYCQEVLKTIETVLEKKYRMQDIVILVRDNKHGVLLAKFLTQQGIQVISSDSLLIKSSPIIKFLVHLLQFSTTKEDLETGYHILSFLAPDNEDKHAFIHEHLTSIPQFLKTQYNFELTHINEASTYDGLEYAIKRFKLTENSDAYVTYFMDVVFEVEQKEGTGIQQFLSHWEKKKDRLGITAPENVAAIQIMSVHKSKGLEFPIVIFPFANAHIYKEIDPKLWLPVNIKAFEGFEELLISKKQEVLNYGPEAAILYEEEQHKLELDAFNVLYVALTRAVKALYIISEKDLTSKGTHKTDYYSGLFIHYLIQKGFWNKDENLYAFGTLEISAEIYVQNAEQSISYQYSHKERAAFKILAKSGVLWDTHTENALLRGNLIHHIMGLIETKKDVTKALGTLQQNGDIAAEEIDYITSKVNQIITHPQLEKFYSEGSTIYNERDILTEEGKLLRPDRVNIRKNRATLIDYKTGKKNPKYHEQLYSYADALTAMDYEIENKIIVYINEIIIPEFI